MFVQSPIDALRKGKPMKKLTAFVMIVCMGMFCSLGCSKPAEETPPSPPSADTPAGDAEKTPTAEEGKEAPADTPAEKTEEPAPEKKAAE